MLKSEGDFQISWEIFIFVCSEINIYEAVFAQIRLPLFYWTLSLKIASCSVG